MRRGIDQTLDMFYEQDNVKSISEVNRDENYKQILNDDNHLCYTQQLVFDVIASYGSISDREIVDILSKQGTPLPLSSVNGRRNELVKMGKVIADEQPITRPDYRNQMRTVTGWRAIL